MREKNLQNVKRAINGQRCFQKAAHFREKNMVDIIMDLGVVDILLLDLLFTFL